MTVTDRFTEVAERYVPDAFIFALLATFLVCIAAVFVVPPGQVIQIWGSGFWELLPFTMQMSMILISGYVVASSAPVARLISKIASVPRSDRQAVAWVALFSMLSAWLNWGLSLVFSAMLAKEMARQRPKCDYKVLGAAAFMGLGSMWAQGLSGSAALLMATENAIPPGIKAISGVIPLSQTIFLWQSIVSVVVEIVVVTAVFFFIGSRGPGRAIAPEPAQEATTAATPGEWLEHSRILSYAFVALSCSYLYTQLSGIASFSFNTVNLIFLTLGVALHGTPHRLMKAFREATPGVWALVLQYPFYAGIAALIAKTHLNQSIAGFFVSLSNARTFPALIAVYSALLGMLVPSGGSKWVIEAPYVLQAAIDLKVHTGWMVAVYDLGEALANLVQPFWMLPVLAVLGLKARDVMGTTFLVFLVLTPVVLLLVTLLQPT